MASLLKRFSIYGLVALLLVQCFGQEILLARLLWNRTAITARFCVNKTRPRLHCDGKCYFAKQLKKQEERESKSAGPSKERLEMLPVVVGSLVPARPTAYRLAAARYRRLLAPAAPEQGLRAVLKPPQQVG